mmetsp:Transcript_28407/g.79930  ORF Transcript_28407/g.79930 Transcript_28407/m.79930 type:complete len:252 (+) Transcript_28407:352-1107(+)
MHELDDILLPRFHVKIKLFLTLHDNEFACHDPSDAICFLSNLQHPFVFRCPSVCQRDSMWQVHVADGVALFRHLRRCLFRKGWRAAQFITQQLRNRASVQTTTIGASSARTRHARAPFFRYQHRRLDGKHFIVRNQIQNNAHAIRIIDTEYGLHPQIIIPRRRRILQRNHVLIIAIVGRGQFDRVLRFLGIQIVDAASRFGQHRQRRALQFLIIRKIFGYQNFQALRLLSPFQHCFRYEMNWDIDQTSIDW